MIFTNDERIRFVQSVSKSNEITMSVLLLLLYCMLTTILMGLICLFVNSDLILTSKCIIVPIVFLASMIPLFLWLKHINKNNHVTTRPNMLYNGVVSALFLAMCISFAIVLHAVFSWQFTISHILCVTICLLLDAIILGSHYLNIKNRKLSYAKWIPIIVPIALLFGRIGNSDQLDQKIMPILALCLGFIFGLPMSINEFARYFVSQKHNIELK